MVLSKGRLVVALLLWVGATFASAGTIEPILELKVLSVNGDASGINATNEHEISVVVGDTVQLVYEITDAPDLGGWQDDFAKSGPASELSLIDGASWWETVSGPVVTDIDLVQRPDYGPGVERWRFLGTNGTATIPPVPVTPPPGSSLAVFEFTCDGEGDVIINGLMRPFFWPVDPASGQLGAQYSVDVLNSDPMVTIHQELGNGPAPDWSFEYEVNNALLGDITGTPLEGTHPDGTTIDLALIAAPFDPTIARFLSWELVGNIPSFPGDLSSPALSGSFVLTDNVLLTANFGVIPEPATMAILCGGMALLARRRRRLRA